MATVVYLLCAVTSVLCAGLLFREYRRSRTRLLLWSAVAFAGLALSNGLAFIDYVLVPHLAFPPVRPPLTALSIAALLYGLVWEAD